MDYYGFYTGKEFTAYEYLGRIFRKMEQYSAPLPPTPRGYL